MQNRLIQLRGNRSVNILPNSYYLSNPWPQMQRSPARVDRCESRRLFETVYYVQILQQHTSMPIYEEPAPPPPADSRFKRFWKYVLKFIAEYMTYSTRSFASTYGIFGIGGRAPLSDRLLKDL